MICPTFAYGLMLCLNRILSMHRCRNWPPSFSGKVGVSVRMYLEWCIFWMSENSVKYSPAFKPIVSQEGETFWRGQCLSLSVGHLHIQLTSQHFVPQGERRALPIWSSSATPHMKPQHNVKPMKWLTSGKLACIPATEWCRCLARSRLWSCSHQHV